MRNLAAGLLALSLLGCATDAAVPVGWAPVVGAARASLLSEDDDPTSSFAFLEIRCRADGGRLVVFVQRSLFSGQLLAYAMQGPGADPTSADAWAGGLNVRDLENDSEIAHFFGESPKAPCPAQA